MNGRAFSWPLSGPWNTTTGGPIVVRPPLNPALETPALLPVRFRSRPWDIDVDADRAQGWRWRPFGTPAEAPNRRES